MQHNERGQEMMSWLPWYYGDSRIMNEIIGAQSKEIVSTREGILYILNQFFVDKADAKGLELWEKELAITPQDESNLFLRRAHIKAKLRRPPIMTPQQIESIVNLFVENKSAKVIEKPGTYHFDIDIDLDTTKIYLSELVAELEEAKPAHLGYGINIHWEIDISGESSIKVGVTSAQGGNVRIGIDVPKEELARMFTSVLPATTGIRTIRAGSTESREPFPLGAGFHIGTGGVLKLLADFEDLPKWYKDAWKGYSTPRLGFSESIKGVRSFGLPLPDDDRRVIKSAIALLRTGLRQYGLAPPDDSRTSFGAGIAQLISGQQSIPANPDDVPNWYRGITNDVRILPRLGITETSYGQTHIGTLTPEQEAYSLRAGVINAIHGTVTIGAETGDLPGSPTEARAAIRIFGKLVEFARHIIHLDTPEDSGARIVTGVRMDSSGRHIIPIETPDSSRGAVYIGATEVSGGQRQITADREDIPKHYLNPLDGACASIRVSTTIYTKGTHKTSLSSPQDARARPTIGINSIGAGKTTIESTKSDIDARIYSILKPSCLLPRVGFAEGLKKKTNISLHTPEGSGTGFGVGALSYFSGATTIGPDTGDVPDWRRDILSPSRSIYNIGLSESRAGRRIIPLEQPETTEGKIVLGITITPKKRTIIHLPLTRRDGANPGLGIGAIFTGRTVIEADLEDLKPKPVGILPHAGLLQMGTLGVG